MHADRLRRLSFPTVRHTTSPASSAKKSPTGEDDFWPSERPAKGGSRRLIIAVVVVVLLLVAAGVAYFVLKGEDSPAVRTADLRPTSYTPSAPDPGTAKISLRTADARPLNEGEVFTAEAKAASYRNFAFSLVASKISSDCAAVTLGDRLRGDLRKHGCSQIVRGAYLSKDKKHTGQFVVINLDGVEGAQQIVRALDPATGSGVVVPLEGAGIEAFGKGFSAAYAKPFGHYVLLTWVQRNGGADPASMNEMIDASLAIEGAADGFAWQRLILAGG